MANLDGERLGKYTLIERIGRGGMSAVYRAVPESGGAEVAVKVLVLDNEQAENEVFLARFEREAQIINDLQHERILPMLDIGREGEKFYYVMPLIRGGTLVDLIRRGPLDVEAVSYWITQISSALDYAHNMQVIHRDLKPNNVLLDEVGNAYLTDFGIAKLTTHTSHLTQTGIVIGTPAYMAPEQWRDEQLDRRTDVYGLGIMTYLLLTTHTPFESETAHAMMYQHLNEPPPAIKTYRPDIPDAVEQVVMKALAKSPERRYDTAGAFAEDFRRAVEGRPTLAISLQPTPSRVPKAVELPPPAYRSERYDHLRQRQQELPPPRWWFLALAAAVMLVAAVTIGLGLWFGVGQLLADNEAGQNKAPAGESTTSPLDVPRLRLDNPPGNLSVAVGETVTIQVTAFDTAGKGVTRVEMRRTGSVLQVVASSNPAGQAVLPAQFVYTPASVGQHQLELIAYRGSLPSDSRFITINAR